jgi:hypothetical protein
MNIKDMVKDQKKATFLHYKNGELWYTTECGFQFPVPISDVGTATLLSQDKALLLMRYIRKHLELHALASEST